MNLLSGKGMEKQQQEAAILVVMGIVISLIAIAVIKDAMASTLSIEDPPMQGHALNLSRDEMDRDLTIDPDSNFTGTQELPTEGATDIDINTIPPVGVSIIITNETVVVTKEPVTVG